MQKKQIFTLIVLIGILAIGYWGLGKLNTLKLARTESIKNMAWETFKNYLDAAKNKDLTLLKNYSYALSETCLDNTKKKECDELMSNAYFFGAGIEKDSITQVLYDDRQIILLGEYKETLSNGVASVARPVIYFVREGDVIKVLSFNPFQGSFLIIGESSTSTAMLKVYDTVKDTDNDTLSDMTEECKDFVKLENCQKTDPTKKDTDRNGFWDSTQSLFRN